MKQPKITSDGETVSISMNILDVDTFTSILNNGAMSLDDVDGSDSDQVNFIYDLTRQLSKLTDNI